MSSDTRIIYEEYIKALSREEQRVLFNVLQAQLDDDGDNGQRHSILELHGLGREIWDDVDPREYVRRLREEWDERVG